MNIVDTTWRREEDGSIAEYKKVRVIVTSRKSFRESSRTFGAIQSCIAADEAKAWFDAHPGGDFLKNRMVSKPTIDSYQIWNHDIFDTELKVIIDFDISTKALSEFYLRYNTHAK